MCVCVGCGAAQTTKENNCVYTHSAHSSIVYMYTHDYVKSRRGRRRRRRSFVFRRHLFSARVRCGLVSVSGGAHPGVNTITHAPHFHTQHTRDEYPHMYIFGGRIMRSFAVESGLLILCSANIKSQLLCAAPHNHTSTHTSCTSLTTATKCGRIVVSIIIASRRSQSINAGCVVICERSGAPRLTPENPIRRE